MSIEATEADRRTVEPVMEIARNSDLPDWALLAIHERAALIVAMTRAAHTCNGTGCRTHCPAGHAYDEANTYHSPSGRRHCRQCQRDRWNAKVAARKAADEIAAEETA